jgi:hypothetical protein
VLFDFLFDFSKANVVDAIFLFLLQISVLVGGPAIPLFFQLDLINHLAALLILLVERVPVDELSPEGLGLVEYVAFLEGCLFSTSVLFLMFFC